MLDKNKVLSCTRDGLDIFKHYLPGEWRVGRNFKNPFYDDTKASCNIYFDRRSGMYRMKDGVEMTELYLENGYDLKLKMDENNLTNQ